MSFPLVSVIIPAYNAESFIEETLDSVVAQTYRPIEIIIVDDGSADGTSEVIKKYTTDITDQTDSTDITVIYIHQQNSGPSAARNAGIMAASGEYVAFLDADDLWAADKLERQMELFRKDIELDIVCANQRVTRTGEGGITEFVMFKSNNLGKEFFGHEWRVVDPLVKLLKINFMPTSSGIARKSCFKEGFLFNERRRYAEDWELWLNMALDCSFGYVDAVCVHKKEKGGGLSSNADAMLLSKIEVMEEFVKKNQAQVLVRFGKDQLSKYLRETYKWAGYHFMIAGNSKLARRYLVRSLQELWDMKTALYYVRTFVQGQVKYGK